MASAGPQRVGLVLGAGGVLGGAWLTGALHAIARETGWDPGSSEHVVGTSAGAMIGALLACGVPPWFMVAHSAGEEIDGLHDARGVAASEADRSAGMGFRLHGGLPSLGPASWRLAAASLARPYRHSPAALVAGWLPHGPFSTEPLKDTIRRACEEDWAPHPNYWAIAVDYRTGARVALGAADAPPAQLPDAVAASCAIPGFFRAVEIDGRPYVDGGVHSASNLDVLAGHDLDLVIALNPMSSLHVADPRTLGERVAYAIRSASGRRLGAEARSVRASGTEVVLIQPTVHDLDAMGSNLMSRTRRHEVIETAVASVTEHLRESPLGERLAELPPGQPELVRRPPGPASSWTDFRDLARARFSASAAR
ncbi:MAG TPA: patatin-like phospholipase family protein [Solirubrobacteraceae bacterium]|nr:patatin-like phospholipase family protein [Solirubrobacteraceae bacterium]